MLSLLEKRANLEAATEPYGLELGVSMWFAEPEQPPKSPDTHRLS